MHLHPLRPRTVQGLALGVFLSLTGLPGQESRPAPDNLTALCRLWGGIKYYHPHLATRDVDWDQALIDALPGVERARTEEQLMGALARLLAPLGDGATRLFLAQEAAAPLERGRLMEIEWSRPRQPLARWIGEDVALITATDYEQITAETFTQGASGFIQALLACRGARTLVLDLRLLPDRGDERADEIDQWSYAWAFRSALPLLLEQDLALSSKRVRMQVGLPPDREIHRDLFFSGLFLEEHPVLPARGSVLASNARLIFVVNLGSRDSLDALAGLQAGGRAVVLFHGDHPERMAYTFTLPLPGRIRARVRVADALNPDGTVGFLPDLVVPAEEDPMPLALALARGERPAPRAARVVEPLQVPVQLLEDAYPEMLLPDREHRLLALFRFWNAIEFFYPYKDLLDQPWDITLELFLPRFAGAKTALEYHLAAAELAASLKDTHGWIRSSVLDEHFGTHCPPLRIRMLQGQAIVETLLDPGEAPGLSQGDRILAVDGEPVEALCRRLTPYLAHSTPQALAARLGETLLCGPPGKEVRLLVQGEAGAPRELLLPRTLAWPEVKQAAILLRPGQAFSRLPGGVGYLDLARLDRASFPRAFAEIEHTDALILDLRGYPKGTAWLLAPRLGPESRAAAIFSKAFQFLPHAEVGRPTFSFTQPTPPPLGTPYAGRVAVLIDEETISQGEHTCLYIAAAREVVFIGTPTNGTNGDITNIPLPGNILVTFTGHGVTWPDGRRLQRKGIQPDIPVAPTPGGFRAGRDEVLDRALEYCKSGK